MAVQNRRLGRAAVRKAKPDETWIAAYDQNGKLIGIVDPKKLTPLSDDADDETQADPATAPKAAAVPAPTPDQEAMAKQRQVVALRKGLNAPGLAADNDRRAAQMGAAAWQVLAAIHDRPAPRR